MEIMSVQGDETSFEGLTEKDTLFGNSPFNEVLHNFNLEGLRVWDVIDVVEEVNESSDCRASTLVTYRKSGCLSHNLSTCRHTNLRSFCLGNITQKRSCSSDEVCEVVCASTAGLRFTRLVKSNEAVSSTEIADAETTSAVSHAALTRT